ncbi:MAG TPA: methyltransferase domain-containing protein, partial [bacterium]|nr:methyltransferase domain-containing protein [bacterium]
EGFAEALNMHTDAVAEIAGLLPGQRVLDIGCGIGAPAIRIAGGTGCSIVGINISSEQVKQGRALVKKSGLCDLVELRKGNALSMDFPEASFDSVLCIEVAGDICVTPEQKGRLISEMHRVLKPGGSIGFSDLVFTGKPTRAEESSMRAILYHDGSDLVTDWPELFADGGFEVVEKRDIISETMPMWTHSLAIYEERASDVRRRYGRRIAEKTMEHLRAIPGIMQKYGSFVLLSARKRA